MSDTLKAAMADMGRNACDAARALARSTPEMRNAALSAIAERLRAHSDAIIEENAKDIRAARDKGLSDALVDRLLLDATRINGMAKGVDAIAAQDEALERVLDRWTQPNGLRFRKVAVPIGVIGMIYESRPNVTVDAAALCLKSGNAVILRGGSEAVHSNRCLHALIVDALDSAGLPKGAVQFVPTQDRAAVGHMLAGLDGMVDLIIPRGGKGLVERVQREARVPVLAHLDGLNHTYIHVDADLDMAVELVLNAKMRRTGVCGATETVLVDAGIADAVLPPLAEALRDAGCELRGDAQSRAIVAQIVTATAEDFDTEHLAPILNVAIVDDQDAAHAHIANHGSGHTEAIVTEDASAARRFLGETDAAIVLHNASTQFADGGEFGFGAEIGIATGRLHARGPVGAQQLTSFKYQVVGDGTVRP